MINFVIHGKFLFFKIFYFEGVFGEFFLGLVAMETCFDMSARFVLLSDVEESQTKSRLNLVFFTYWIMFLGLF